VRAIVAAAAIAAAALRPAPAAFAAALAVTVLPAAEVAAPSVALGDCARISGPGAAGLARAVVAASPQPGVSMTISAAQIRAVLAGLGVRGAAVSGAARCVVTVPSQVVPVSRIAEAAARAVSAALPPLGRGWAYVVSPLTSPQPVVAPAGPLAVSGALRAGPPVPGVATVSVRIEQGGRLVRAVPVAVQVAIRGPVLVAARDLPYHTALGAGSAEVQVREIASAWGTPLADPGRLVGMWTTQLVPEGAVLTDRMVAPAPAVQRGDFVTVRVSRGPLVVSATGRAREDGIVGQEIRVEIDGTHAIVQGRVTGPGDVEIALP
jgi:flagella basal body P-ring formation protein FlgA